MKASSKSVKHVTDPRARAFWSGTISFGLVSIPVYLFPATRGRGASLRMLDVDGTPVQRLYYCPKHERDIHPEHIVRGFQLENDEYVVVQDDELESIEPKKSRDIDLQRFVDQAQVSSSLWERGYFLTPAGDSTKAYRLLADAMERTGRAGIATFVMRGKEYLIAIMAENGILRAETLRFQDEVRTPEEIGLPEQEKASRQLVSKMARAIQKHSSKKLNEDEMSDDYVEKLHDLATKKLRHHEDVVEVGQAESAELAEDDEEGPVDLLDIIRQSLHSGNGKAANGKAAKDKATNGKATNGKAVHRASSNGHTRRTPAPKKSRSKRTPRS